MFIHAQTQILAYDIVDYILPHAIETLGYR